MPTAVILVENLPVPLDRRTWQEAITLHAAGWDVTVISPRGAGSMRRWRDTIDGVKVRRYPQRAASGLAGYLAEYLPSMLFTAAWFIPMLARRRIDVVQGCNPPDLFWLFGWLAKRRGGRYVFDQHDANPELSLTKFGRSAKGRLLHRLTVAMEAASYRTADLVIAPNDSYLAIARRRGHVPPARLRVVRNAPDIERYQQLAAGIEPELRVGYVGVMGSQDGLEILVDAWRRVVAEPDLDSAVLELVGDGEARRRLEDQVADLVAAGRVRFHGYLQPDAFVPILAACACTVSPDPPTPFNAVSTMVKVVDSLAIGRPVVSFDLEETRRLVGDAGVIIERAGAPELARGITGVLRDPVATRRMAEAAARRVTDLQLGWNRSAAVLTAAYAELRAP